MCKDMCARWSKGIFVEIKGSKDLGIGREFGVHARSTEEINSYITLFYEIIPKREWEVWVSSSKASNEMILVGTDGSFTSISTVNAWGCSLEVN